MQHAQRRVDEYCVDDHLVYERDEVDLFCSEDRSPKCYVDDEKPIHMLYADDDEQRRRAR